MRKKRKRKKESLKTSIWSGSAESFTKTEVEKRKKTKKKTRWNTKSGFYVMPAASQSEPQDAYGEAEKTNTEGCPFCILDAFPSRKYQSLPGTLQNQFTQTDLWFLPYKGLNALGLTLSICLCTCHVWVQGGPRRQVQLCRRWLLHSCSVGVIMQR